jgi:hypothetical protein
MEKGLVGGFRFSGITLLDEIIGQYVVGEKRKRLWA